MCQNFRLIVNYLFYTDYMFQVEFELFSEQIAITCGTWRWQRSGHSSGWPPCLGVARNLWSRTVIRLEQRSWNKRLLRWEMSFCHICYLDLCFYDWTIILAKVMRFHCITLAKLSDFCWLTQTHLLLDRGCERWCDCLHSQACPLQASQARQVGPLELYMYTCTAALDPTYSSTNGNTCTGKIENQKHVLTWPLVSVATLIFKGIKCNSLKADWTQFSFDSREFCEDTQPVDL